MVELVSLRWLLTVIFAATTAYDLRRLARRASSDHRISALADAVMSTAMIVMVWPWGHAVSAPAWLLVFGAGAAWFAGRALVDAGRRRVHLIAAGTNAAMAYMGAAPAGHHGTARPVDLLGTTTIGVWLLAAAVIWCVHAARGFRWSLSPVRPAQPITPAHSSLCRAVMCSGMALAVLATV